MKIVNIMNFVRLGDHREDNPEQIMFETTKAELELVKGYGLDNTFLLEYDALTDKRYIDLFKNEADETTEIGLWYEMARPLVEDAGLLWRGDPDVTWDWHIVPGFSMAYTQKERELLADTAMNKFKEIYGFYPKTVASWLIDTYTVNYICEKYAVSAIAICRDQTNTDAYTLIGGYFNQGYYPSKNNMFTPAQSNEYRINTPVFRLLGPDPIHNYDERKYCIEEKLKDYLYPFTLEPIWDYGNDKKITEYMFESYFKNESLNFAYAQLGQENSFGCRGGLKKIIDGLKKQIDTALQYPDIKIMKMCDTGELFKKTFADTPASAVCALSEWNGDKNVQSVYYDCKNYSANLFRFNNKIFIRSLYLFDETVYDKYYETPCKSFDAVYENLPIVDTLLWEDDNGLLLDNDADAFEIKKLSQSSLQVSWRNKSVVFGEDKIEIENADVSFNLNGTGAEISALGNKLLYNYNGNNYSAEFLNSRLSVTDEIFHASSDGKITIQFKKA